MVLELMVSAAMAVQDQCGGAHSNLAFSASNESSSYAGLLNVTGLEIKDQFPCGTDYAPKPRKPYTITKQRERWTEEEHKKFLEALKLFGRAWRKIEEHVGTKTAVQIRSHAQKFFSKVVRESNGSSTSLTEAIEIPPPRPKRKPVHPYPRKSVHPSVKDSPNPELSRRLSSPNLSISEEENQSPTSVLSAVVSDVFGSSDSHTLNDSLSPVSSVSPAELGGFSKHNSSPEENGSQSPVLETIGSVPDEQSPMNVPKLGLSPEEFAKGRASTRTRSLKLFGTTVLVTDCQRPSPSTPSTCKLFLSDVNDGKPLQLLPLKLMRSESPSRDTKYSSKQLPHAGSGALCCMQRQGENSNVVEIGSDAQLPLPWWTFFGGTPFPVTPDNKPEPTNMCLNSTFLEVQEKEFQKEGSWTGSNSKSVNEHDNFEKTSDVETQSCQQSLNEEENGPDMVFELKPSEKSAFSIIRASPMKHMKGFVPYKKRVAQRHNQSPAVTGDEREERRLRHCY